MAVTSMYFPVRLVFQALDDLQEVQLGQAAHRKHFFFLQTQLLLPLLGRRHFLFGRFGNLPVGHLRCIVGHRFFLLFGLAL